METSTAECTQNTIKLHNYYQRACEILEHVIEAVNKTEKKSMNISGRTASK
jgi:hypothetical protein